MKSPSQIKTAGEKIIPSQRASVLVALGLGTTLVMNGGCSAPSSDLVAKLSVPNDGRVTGNDAVPSDNSMPADSMTMGPDSGTNDAGMVEDRGMNADTGNPVLDSGMPTLDTGMVNPVDVVMPTPDVVVPPADRGTVVEDSGTEIVDSGLLPCQPTDIRIGVRIGTSNVVNSNTAPINIGYSGDCSDMMNTSVTFSVRPGDTFNQSVVMTSVDASAHVMRGVLNISEFTGFPDNSASMTLSATIRGRALSATFSRDVVRPIIITGSGNTRVNPLSAGSISYSFNFRGDSSGRVFVSFWRQRDNFPLFRTSGTSTLCVRDNTVQTCSSDALGEEQLCHATTSTANACVSRRLIFDVVADTPRSISIPDADFQHAVANSVNTDTIRAELVYCDSARNCVSASYNVSRTN